MHVELHNLSLRVSTQPLRFGRSVDCELTLPTADRNVPTLLGCVHYQQGEPTVSNLHHRFTFDVVSGRQTRTVPAEGAVRLRNQRSRVVVGTERGIVGFDVIVDDSDIPASSWPRRLSGMRTTGVTSDPPLALKPGQLRDLAAVYRPTLEAKDFSVIRVDRWDVAAARVGTTAANLKGRVLRTIADAAHEAGCPRLSGLDSRQVLGRWLIENGVLKRDLIRLLD